jgi:hypothetical protein
VRRLHCMVCSNPFRIFILLLLLRLICLVWDSADRHMNLPLTGIETSVVDQLLSCTNTMRIELKQNDIRHDGRYSMLNEMKRQL